MTTATAPYDVNGRTFSDSDTALQYAREMAWQSQRTVCVYYDARQPYETGYVMCWVNPDGTTR